MAKSVSERVLLAARAQLREAARDVLAGALDTLEARVVRDSRARRGYQLEHMREVLERDRALVSATLPHRAAHPVEASAPAAAAPEPALPVCDEPVPTRTMAKLLAAQGHPERALGIYAYLLAKDGSNPALLAEIAALREALPGASAK